MGLPGMVAAAVIGAFLLLLATSDVSMGGLMVGGEPSAATRGGGGGGMVGLEKIGLEELGSAARRRQAALPPVQLREGGAAKPASAALWAELGTRAAAPDAAGAAPAPARASTVTAAEGCAMRAAHLPAGCGVCCDEDFRHTIDPGRELICQSFWHVRYKSWPECLAAALSARSAMRKELCSMCRAEDRRFAAAGAGPKPKPASGNRRRGVVFGMMGSPDRYLGQAARSIRVLRKYVRYTGPIQVFADTESSVAWCTAHTQGLDVDCKQLSRAPKVGFASKLMAMNECSFDEALMMDTDNILLRDPALIFEHKLFTQTGVLMWPDLWGAACEANSWGKSDSNPNGIMMCGQTAWQDHVIWPVADLQWQPKRAYTQEHIDSQLALDKTRVGVQMALRLGLWLAETEFGKNVLYGEKDAVRVGFLAMGVPFDFVFPASACL